MANCEGLKRKARLGFVLICAVSVLGPLAKSGIYLFSTGMAIILVIVGILFGLVLALPYVKCLQDYNDRFSGKKRF